MESTLIGRKDGSEGEKLKRRCGEKKRQNRKPSSLSCVITA